MVHIDTIDNLLRTPLWICRTFCDRACEVQFCSLRCFTLIWNTDSEIRQRINEKFTKVSWIVAV